MNISARAIIPNNPATHALTMREKLQVRIDELGLDLLTQLDLIFASKRLPPNYLRFQGYAIINHQWLVYQLNPRYLGNLAISDLLQPAVTERLSAVARRTVRAQFTPAIGLTYSIALREDPVSPPLQPLTLPRLVNVDLSNPPARPLSVPFGVLTVGAQDLDLRLPYHILIGGTTSNGKTIDILSKLAVLCLFNTPEQVKIVIVDLKGDFIQWRGIPHLLRPIARTPQEAMQAIEAVVQVMDDRRDEFEAVNARNLQHYEQRTGKTFPLVVLVIDEFAEIALEVGRDYMPDLTRLVNRAGSYGIRLILSTQSPKAEIVTPLIREQCKIRIAYGCESPWQSEAILGQGHSEAKDIPNIPGRFIAKLPGERETVTGQAYFIDNATLDAVTDRLRAMRAPAAGKEIIDQVAVSTPPARRALRVNAQETLWLKWCADPEQGGVFNSGAIHERFEVPDNKSSPIRALGARLLREGWLLAPKKVTDPRRFSAELHEAVEEL